MCCRSPKTFSAGHARPKIPLTGKGRRGGRLRRPFGVRVRTGEEQNPLLYRGRPGGGAVPRVSSLYCTGQALGRVIGPYASGKFPHELQHSHITLTPVV